MIQFRPEAPAKLHSQYIVAGYRALFHDKREIRIVFIIGRRLVVNGIGIREASKDLSAALEHPRLASYMKSILVKFEKKTSFAKSLYVVPEVNETLAAYMDI